MCNACQSFGLGQESDRAVGLRKISENGNETVIGCCLDANYALLLAYQVDILFLNTCVLI
jgi:hypothetical protein